MLCKDLSKSDDFYLKHLNNTRFNVIIFPRMIDNLGYRMYKFTAVFQIDKQNSSPENGTNFIRVDDHFKL